MPYMGRHVVNRRFLSSVVPWTLGSSIVFINMNFNHLDRPYSVSWYEHYCPWYEHSCLYSVSCHSNAAGYKSNSQTLTCGVSQGSVLGPLRFILHTSPLSKLISSSSVDHHLYADDTQLFTSVFSHSLKNALNQVHNTVTQISISLVDHKPLCLNPSKMGGDLAPGLGGRTNIFADKIFE